VITYKTRLVDGLNIFYREAGSSHKDTLVLLHGFPSSSHMFRNLMSRLEDDFRLIAPDYPGFGHSDAPASGTFVYTFDHLSEIIEKLLIALGINRFGLFIQDYGAPVGLRIASRHPEWIDALICQNANAYEDGLSNVWDALRALWQDPSVETETPLRGFLTLEGANWIYTHGTRSPENISPDNWTLDVARLNRSGNDRIQLDLFYDYRRNVELYPRWQAYFREHQPPSLIVWGKNDPIFNEAGALAFQKDLRNAEVHLLDTGHFALEEDCDVIADLVKQWHRTRARRADSALSTA
jgi:pimeloyl-ACP methyl ester carboxylesterase